MEPSCSEVKVRMSRYKSRPKRWSSLFRSLSRSLARSLIRSARPPTTLCANAMRTHVHSIFANPLLSVYVCPRTYALLSFSRARINKKENATNFGECEQGGPTTTTTLSLALARLLAGLTTSLRRHNLFTFTALLINYLWRLNTFYCCNCYKSQIQIQFKQID